MGSLEDSNTTDSRDNTLVAYADTGQLDAFGRLRVSSSEGLFDSTFLFDKQPLLFSESATSGGTATWNSNTCSVDLAVTTTTNSEIIFQSKRYIKYHPGKSQLVFITGNIGSTATNVRKRLGYFDANNGVFFEQNSSNLSVVVRTKTSGSVVDTAIAQASWNIDKLDGTGISRYTLDTTKQQIFLIDFQWLGSGRIRFGFMIDGKITYCHEVLNANVLTVPWSQTGNSPLRLEVKNSASSASSLSFTCCSIISENFYGPEGTLRTVNNGTTTRSLGLLFSTLPLLSLRKQSSYVVVPVQVIDFGFFANSSDDFLISLVLNGTLTGASWANVSGVCQSDVSASAISGGDSIYSFYLRGGSGVSSTQTAEFFKKGINTFLGSNIGGTSDIISVVASNLTATASAYATINYRELL